MFYRVCKGWSLQEISIFILWVHSSPWQPASLHSQCPVNAEFTKCRLFCTICPALGKYSSRDILTGNISQASWSGSMVCSYWEGHFKHLLNFYHWHSDSAVTLTGSTSQTDFLSTLIRFTIFVESCFLFWKLIPSLKWFSNLLSNTDI